VRVPRESYCQSQGGKGRGEEKRKAAGGSLGPRRGWADKKLEGASGEHERRGEQLHKVISGRS